MFCSGCGNEVPENVKFCKKCGTAVDSVQNDTPASAEPKPPAQPVSSLQTAKKVKKKRKDMTAAERLNYKANDLLKVGAIMGVLIVVLVICVLAKSDNGAEFVGFLFPVFTIIAYIISAIGLFISYRKFKKSGETPPTELAEKVSAKTILIKAGISLVALIVGIIVLNAIYTKYQEDRVMDALVSSIDDTDLDEFFDYDFEDNEGDYVTTTTTDNINDTPMVLPLLTESEMATLAEEALQNALLTDDIIINDEGVFKYHGSNSPDMTGYFKPVIVFQLRGVYEDLRSHDEWFLNSGDGMFQFEVPFTFTDEEMNSKWKDFAKIDKNIRTYKERDLSYMFEIVISDEYCYLYNPTTDEWDYYEIFDNTPPLITVNVNGTQNPSFVPIDEIDQLSDPWEMNYTWNVSEYVDKLTESPTAIFTIENSNTSGYTTELEFFAYRGIKSTGQDIYHPANGVLLPHCPDKSVIIPYYCTGTNTTEGFTSDFQIQIIQYMPYKDDGETGIWRYTDSWNFNEVSKYMYAAWGASYTVDCIEVPSNYYAETFGYFVIYDYYSPKYPNGYLEKIGYSSYSEKYTGVAGVHIQLGTPTVPWTIEVDKNFEPVRADPWVNTLYFKPDGDVVVLVDTLEER